MLSSKPIKNVRDASDYYNQKDNYYTREEGIQASEWWGKGALKLNLTGSVDEKKFTELLQGKLPNGEQIGKIVNGEINHRPGWDLTLSAPKSFSIIALIGGDKRLFQAQIDSVYVALSCIERYCAEARIKTKDGIEYQPTGNLVAALFPHDVSREQDPQIHTHAVIMNMTERGDQKWRSLASQSTRYDEHTLSEVHGFIERVRHNNRFFAKIYETELSYRVKQLGYEITTDTPSGKFEIVGVPQDVIEFFSKRRQQIKEALELKAFSGGKAAEMATLSTRQNKKEVDRQELKAQWLEDAKQFNFDCEKVVADSIKKEKIYEQNTNPLLNDHPVFRILEKSANALSIFQTTFSLDELLLEASNYAIREGIDVDTLLKGIDVEVKSGALIQMAEVLQGKSLYMAKSSLEDEKRLSFFLRNNLLSKSTIKESHLEHYFSQNKDTPLLHDKLKSIFGREAVVLIEGRIAKEALMEPMIKMAKSVSLDFMILSPTQVGSKKLAKEMSSPHTFWEQIKAIFTDLTPKHESVMQFLSRFNEGSTLPVVKPDIVIVDQVHLLSTHLKANLIEWSNKYSTKLILLGEKETLLPQQRGTSIEKLIAEGVKSISVGADEYNPIAMAIQKTVDKIIPVQDTEERFDAMANHYLRLSEKIRKNSWLLGQTKKSAEILNTLTHQKMVEQNKITGVSNLNVLMPVFLAQDKAELAGSYQKNHIIRFNEAYPSFNINRGEYLRVLDTNKKSNRVLLQKSSGEAVSWYPDKLIKKSGDVELFQEKERKVGIGESVLFHRSIKTKNIVKGERLTIEKFNHNQIIMKTNYGKKVILDVTKSPHLHFDYGYAATPHPIAHEKPDCIIADFPAKSFGTDQRHFNQILSQPKKQWIYTDNMHALCNQLAKRTGNRLTAHEMLKQSEESKQNLHSLYDVLEKTISHQLNGKNIDVTRKAIDAIDYAMKHLSEREAGFTHQDLMEVGMRYALGDVKLDQLRAATLQMEKSGILMRGIKNNQILWTTVEAVKLEREILSLTTKDQGKMTPIATDEMISTYCNSLKLRPEHMAAIKAITQSKDRVLSIQGRAGTGKTTLMISLQDVLSAKALFDSSGYHLQGIAPTHKGVKELLSRGITAQTVDSFLRDMRYIQENRIINDASRTILVIDEASMVSNRKMLEVLKIAHDFKYREVISTGDTEQNPSIEGGKPHALIQRELKSTILLKDIQRQKNPVLKKVVEAIYKGNVKETFSLLGDSIIEINSKKINNPTDIILNPKEISAKDYEKRVKAIVSDYIDLLQKGEQAQIITPAHKDRKAVNTETRLQLIQLGILSGDNTTFSILCSKDMTAVERSEAFNFKVGHILRFNLASGKNIKAGDYLTIKEIKKSHNLLTLQSKNGDEISWQIPRSSNRINQMVEVFTREERTLKIGDKLAWTRTNKHEKILSTDTGKVIKIEQDHITIQRHDGSSFTFNGSDTKHQHWDHGYALTAYGVQGGTYSTALGLFESSHKKLMNLKTFLVTITRPENHLRIYTDSKNELQNAISFNKGDKISSLEVIGEYPSQNKIKTSKELDDFHLKVAKDHEQINHKIPLSYKNTIRKVNDKMIKIFNQDTLQISQINERKQIESYNNVMTTTAKTIEKTVQRAKELEHEL